MGAEFESQDFIISKKYENTHDIHISFIIDDMICSSHLFLQISKAWMKTGRERMQSQRAVAGESTVRALLNGNTSEPRTQSF